MMGCVDIYWMNGHFFIRDIMNQKMSVLRKGNQQFQDFEQKLNSQSEFTNNPFLYTDLSGGQFQKAQKEHQNHQLLNKKQVQAMKSKKVKAIDPRLEYNSGFYGSNFQSDALSTKNQLSPQNNFGRGQQLQTQLSTRMEEQDKYSRVENGSDLLLPSTQDKKGKANTKRKYEIKKNQKKKIGCQNNNLPQQKSQEEQYYAYQNYPYHFEENPYPYWQGQLYWNNQYIPQEFPTPFIPIPQQQQFGGPYQEINPNKYYQYEQYFQNEQQMKIRENLNYPQRNSNQNSRKLKSIKQQVLKHQHCYSQKQWEHLLYCIHEVILNRETGVKNLWAFMDSFEGKQRLAKGESIFDIMSVLQCEDTFDALKQQQQAQKNIGREKPSKLKKMLFKLVRRIP